MKIEIVLFILFLHWIADFVLQTDKQAKGKSKNWDYLLSHTAIYSTVFLFTGILLSVNKAELFSVFYFSLITFICHAIIDYFTSRLNSRLWANGEVHYFFVSVGFDQFLHFAQLLITYELLK